MIHQLTGASRGRRIARGQRGATLLISLIMLAVLALFGISAIRSSLVNLRIAGNSQLQLEAAAAAQRAIDARISSLATFTGAPAATSGNFDATGAGQNYSVSVAAPKCVYTKAAPGYSYLTADQAPKDTTWRITAVAQATDGSGVQVTLTEGIKVRLPVTATCN